jgi:hypothetical protein
VSAKVAASVSTPADEPGTYRVSGLAALEPPRPPGAIAGNQARPHAERQSRASDSGRRLTARKIKATNDGIGLLAGPTLSTYG